MEPYEKLLSPIAKRSHRMASLPHHYATRQSCSQLQSKNDGDEDQTEQGSKQTDEGEDAEEEEPAVRAIVTVRTRKVVAGAGRILLL